MAAARPRQHPPAPAPAAALEDLVLANRILADRGVLDAYGHISIRHPSDPNRYLMARAIAPGLVTLDDIMELDLDSNPVDRAAARCSSSASSMARSTRRGRTS